MKKMDYSNCVSVKTNKTAESRETGLSCNDEGQCSLPASGQQAFTL